MEVTEGAVFEIDYPFCWDGACRWSKDPESPLPVENFMAWRPGTASRFCYPDDFDYVAGGLGKMILTVISVHKPGCYPTRVFFTRRWRDPDSKEFGKGNLHIKSLESFRRRLNGYLYEFEIVGQFGTQENAEAA